MQEQPTYDINKTKIIAAMLELPSNYRTTDWDKKFCENILQASFTCGSRQVVQGPDGLPYFKLQFPESGKSFNPISLVSIKDQVLKNGYGVALSINGKQLDCIIPHGAIVNLHVNGELFIEDDYDRLPKRVVPEEKAEVFYSQPLEKNLPATTREALKRFLQKCGIAEPKMMLIRHQSKGISSELVFNIFAEDYPNYPNDKMYFEILMQGVQWFLPRPYVVTVVPKKPEYIENLKPL